MLDCRIPILLFAEQPLVYSRHTNGTELTWNKSPSYMTRSLVTRVSVTTWLAAAKLGRLVLSEFWTHAFLCGCPRCSFNQSINQST